MTDPEMSGRAVLRRLQYFQIGYGAVAIILVVFAGDFVFPFLDRQIGMLASDLLEAAIVAAILYLVARPQMRELTRSIVELDDLRKRFYAESIRDSLSGLFNRRHFDERLTEEFERARRYHQPLSIVILDADHFKAINDELGHPAGDAAIAEIARRLSVRRRRGDVVARFGGDEFVVLLPSLRLSGASAFAEEIRRLIADEPFVLPAKDGSMRRRQITISAGVAELLDQDEFEFDTLKRADAALYEAKASRNAVVAR